VSIVSLLFKTNDMDVVRYCRTRFLFELCSTIVDQDRKWLLLISFM